MLKRIRRVYFILTFIAVVNSNAPELKIQQGILRGQYLKTVKGKGFSAFTSIPYAEPPVGELRFRRSLPAKQWSGILNASKPHPVCPQINVTDRTVRGYEDCLYLNVYTPQITYFVKVLLPVMIFFHGGSYLTGDANRETYGPNYLLEKDIVLVVPNYRLGPLGFLSTGDEIVPGNNGLKDQNLAIKWVKENIAHFGGDPKSITLFGQSVGGSSVHLHMLSPLSRDLIKGVISESSNALSFWAIYPNNQGQRNYRILAQSLNCFGESNSEVVECLRKVEANEITRQVFRFFEWNFNPLAPFKPVIEQNIEGSFLPEHPIDIIKSGKAANIPLMVGFNSEDGAVEASGIFGNPQLLLEFSKDFNRILQSTLFQDEVIPDIDYVTNKIKEFYFDHKDIGNNSRLATTKMYTDGMFLSSTNDAVLLHLYYTKQPVYYYVFGYRGTVSFTSVTGDPFFDYGVSHSDELLYLFEMKKTFPNYTSSESDKNMAEILTTLWTNFAITCNPTPTIDLVIPAIWEPVQSNNLEYYSIRSESDINMAERLSWERAKFWDYLLTRTRNKLETQQFRDLLVTKNGLQDDIRFGYLYNHSLLQVNFESVWSGQTE